MSDKDDDERADKLVRVQIATETGASPQLPTVINAISSEPHQGILALRGDGPNWTLCYFDSLNDALIPGHALRLEKTRALSMLSRFQGLRIEPPIFQTYAGSRKK